MKKTTFLFLLLTMFSIGFGVVYYRQHYGQEQAKILERQPIPEVDVQHAILHPIPDSELGGGELPSLGQSDGTLKEALSISFQQQEAGDFFVLDNLIRRLVVTIDNLPRTSLPRKYLPVRSPEGVFVASAAEGKAVIDRQNYARYTPLIRLVDGIETQTLASLYMRFYPLFQEAYQELGYPDGYFNDRLIEVIDNLLQTPEIAEPIQLVEGSVIYRFADPELESLSAGQ